MPTELLITGADATVFGNAAALSVDAEGAGVVAGAGDGATAVTLGGGGGTVFGGAGAVSVVATGSGSDTIGLDLGFAHITAGGSTSLAVFASNGGLNFVGGAGSSTIFAGTGGASLFGAANGVLTYGGEPVGAGNMIYQAGDGSETINAGFSSAGDSLSGGTVAGSQVSMVGGAGSDTLGAGAGTDTMAGGAGSDLFQFTKAVINGNAPTDIVMDFGSTDSVLLGGYGAAEASTALASAVTVGTDTTLTLSDNTKITFVGTSVAQLTGHITST